MKRFLMIVIALGLAASGCKKDEKAKDEGAGTASGSGSAKASGSGVASGSGSASASGTGVASGSGTDPGSGSNPGSGAAPAAGAVKFDLKIPAVGSESVKQELRVSDLIISANGKQIPMHVEETKLQRTKIVEATDFVQKVEVVYEKDFKVTTMGGKEKLEKSPLEGKSYVVWTDSGKVNATHADGSAVGADELEDISKSFDDSLGRVPGVVTVLTSHTWNPNEAVTLTPDELVTMSKADRKVTAATITLLEESNGKGTFKITMQTEVNSDKLVGKVDVELTATVDLAECRPVKIVTAGKVDATAGGTPLAGDMNSEESYTY